MASWILCAAVEEELAPLLGDLRREGDGWQGRLEGVEVRAFAIGVGPVDAALGAASGLAASRADGAILLGSCGAFVGSGIEIGRAVVVERSILTSSDAASGFAYVPAPAAIPSLADGGLVETLRRRTGLPAVACATVAAITSGEAHARALAAASACQVEHMEAHAFLRAAERAGVPAACLLGVANEVGPDGHEQWKRHGAEASAAAIEALRAFLRGT